jgi:type IV pilus assembly protein PilN
MIRVNLMQSGRPTSQKAAKAPSAPGTVQIYLFLFIFVGGALAACALAWFVVSGQIAELDRQIVQKRDRLTKLQTIKKQVDEFQAKKKELEDKVNLIERLRAEQSGPVHLLDEVSKALPDFVWLTAMEQNGGAITFRGSTTGLTSVADFISNLQRSGWFPSVELRSSTEQNNLVTFEVAANFLDPSVAARQAAAESGPKAGAKGAVPAPAPKK